MTTKNLSDVQLLSNLKELVSREREVLLEILFHLKEVDARKLFLEVGYPSLWAYCREELKYSEASAQRRIEAMRAIRDLPILENKIESGALSLSNVARAQSTMRKASRLQIKNIKIENPHSDTLEQKLDIFLELENKSQKEAERILATHFPEATSRPEIVRPINENTSQIKIELSHELLAKLDEVKILFSHTNPNTSLAETIALMADFIIAKKGVRPTPKINKKGHSHKPVNNEFRENPTHSSPPPQRRWYRSRYIPTEIRRQVWQKAESCCEYTFDGRKCGGQHQLEVEHVDPFAFGGSHNLENLKLLCRAHNRLVARNATLL